VRNTRDDGYERTSPVGAFPGNGYGLYDMIGNVWEWTADWYAGHAADVPACCSAGRAVDAREQSVDRRDPARIPRKVMKGGSHLCAPNYCRRYRPAARMAQPIDTSTSHLGFRCVLRNTR
jgi:formylglycine-generating enzyme required for sulfatase activity